MTIVFDVSSLFYDLQDATSSAKTIVVTELMSTLRNSFHPSASSRRSEDVMILRVALFTERGRMLRILLGLQILFVLHEEYF